VKEPLGDGGHGQTLVKEIIELDNLLERFSSEELASHGLVLETNLRAITTRSVGQTTIGDRMIAYYGTQRSVTNNHRLSVYGGSHLICVRGGWEELENLPMDPQTKLAVSQARAYDQNAARYPGFFASRRNYDVGQGIDGLGQWRSGVLEGSWRSGGASTAEVAALMAFTQDSALQVVEATSIKQFGESYKIPRGAVVHFQGDDPEDGPLLRYTVVTQQEPCRGAETTRNRGVGRSDHRDIADPGIPAPCTRFARYANAGRKYDRVPSRKRLNEVDLFSGGALDTDCAPKALTDDKVLQHETELR
jgi:hypothetical protein